MPPPEPAAFDPRPTQCPAHRPSAARVFRDRAEYHLREARKFMRLMRLAELPGVAPDQEEALWELATEVPRR